MYKPKAKEKIRLTTTLDLLRQNNACESGYKKLRKHLGLKWPDDKPINLLIILKNNGVQDMLWCLRATVEPYADHWRFLCNMYADFAESVIPIYEKFDPIGKAPHKAIEAARSGISETAAGAAEAAWAAGAAEAVGAAWAAGAAGAAEAARAAGAAGAAGSARAAGAAGAAWAARAARAAGAARAARAAGSAGSAGSARADELKKQSVIIRRYLK